jgi:predicted transcriptional regulator
MENLPTVPIDGAQDEERNITWETNHKKIITAINKAMEYFGSLPPTITEISKATGLSRQTVYQHLKNCSTHPAYKQRNEMFEAMQSEVLLQICHSAMRGSYKSARLYLELTGKLQPRAATNNISGNNIQINGMVLNQQIIQNLSPEQLKKIEEIIKPVVQIPLSNGE